MLDHLFNAASEVENFCNRLGWPHCFIGGLALQRWGEPRFTQDIDLSILTGFGGEEPFIDALLSAFNPRRADAREFALISRVVLVTTSGGVSCDISLGGLPFEEQAIARSSLYAFTDQSFVRTCSAEDLITYKAFADRDKDWADILGVLRRQKLQVDKKLIVNDLSPLADLKESPGIMIKLEQVFKQVSQDLERNGMT